MKLCKTLSKRGLALFLALMMCISLLPATAMAEELNAPQALCGLTEHTHGDDCYTTERKLTCTLPEDAGHTHDPAACYDETGAVICGQEEREAGHVHDPELCYADVRGDLICQLAEHVHTADCYAAAEDETDETDSGSMAPQAVSIREPVKIDPAALVEQNSEEGYISLYGLFACASWAGWDEMWLDYGAFLAELTLEYADGTTQTIAFAPAMQDDASTPVLLTDSQVYYNGEAVTVYAGTKVGEIEEDQTPETMADNRWDTESANRITNNSVFLFLAVPGKNSMAIDPDADAGVNWRLMAAGGSKKTGYGAPAQIAAGTRVDSLQNEETIKNYVATWPTKFAGGKVDASGLIQDEGETPSFTIGSDGTVSKFNFTINGTPYTQDTYGIRWISVSHAGHNGSNQLNPSWAAPAGGETYYHINGMLYKKVTVKEVVAGDITVQKTVAEFPAGISTATFDFQIVATDKNGQPVQNADFSPINMRAEVNPSTNNVHIGLANPSDISTPIPAGYYAVKETSSSPIWQADNIVRFNVTMNGDILLVHADGKATTLWKDTTVEQRTITNRLRQYTVTGAIDHGTVSPANDQSVKYGSQSQAVTFTPAAGYKITSVKVTVGNGTPTTITGDDLTLASDGTYTYAATPVTDNIKVEVATGVLPRTYEVRYHKNGGNWAAGIPDPVPVTTNVGTPHTVGNLGNGVADPTHNDKTDGTTAVPVVFLGWTATQTDAQTIIPFGGNVPSSVIPKGNTTRTVSEETDFYAVWAEDRNNDGEADVLQAKVTYQVAPANTGKWTDQNAASYEQFYSMPETGGSYTLKDSDVPTAAGVTVTDASYTTEGAVWSGTGLTGETATPVGQQVAANAAYTYTLTLQLMGDYEVKYYVVDLGTADANAQEVTTDGYSDTVLPSGGKLPHGSTVIFGTSETVTVSIPEEVKYGDNHYVIRQIPDSITIDRHSGKKTVSVYYDLDNWTDPTQVKPGKPHDNIPDKYQVRIEYVVNSAHTALGSIQAPNAAEVKTIYTSEVEYAAQTLKPIDVPSRTAAPAGDGNAFSNWTVPANYTWNATADQRKAETIPAGTKLTVTGGSTYTFTANFEAKATVTYELVSNENPTNTGLPAINPDKVKKGTTNYPVAATPAEQKTEAEKWTFDGWYTTYDEGTKTLSDKVTTATITVSDNMTLYGKWTRAAAAVAKVEYVFQNADGEVVTDGVKTALGAAMPSYTTTNSYVGDSYDLSAADTRTSIVVTAEGAYKGTYRFVSDDSSTTKPYLGTIPSGGLTITRTYQLEAVRGVEVTKAPAAGQDTTVPVKTGNNNTVVNWTITVKNTGNVSATYDISDVLTSGGTNVGDGKVTLTKDGQPLTNNQIIVPKGAEPVTINAAYTVQASDAGKQLVNTATATDTADETVTASHTTTADVGDGKPTEIITVLPTVTVQKVPLKDTYILGANDDGSVDVQWKITVTNTSEVKAEGLSFTDVLKDMSGDSGDVAITGAGLKNDRTFDLEAKGAANKADTKEFTATYKAAEATEAGKDLINTVTVKKGNDPLATAEAQTGIKVIPRDTSFTVAKDLTKVERKDANGNFAALQTVPATVKSGDKLTYTVTVTNTGNVPLTTMLKDVLTANGTPIASAAQDLTVTDLTNVDDPATDAKENQTVITYTYTVQPGDAGKDLVNTVYDGTTEKGSKTVKVDKLTYRVTKTLELTDKDLDGEKLSGVTLKEGKLIIDKGADGKLASSITLLYKITVTGDAGAAYSITDTGAVPVEGYSLSGTLDGADGATVTKDLYVTMAIGVAQSDDGTLTFNNPNGSEGLSNKVTVEGGTTTDKPTDPDPAATFTVSYRYTDDVAASIRTDLTGDAYRTAIYKAGDTVTVAPAATADGYTFSGWSYLERDNIRFNGKAFVMPERDVVLVGRFTPIAYTMQYELHGGTADSAFAKKENVEWLSLDNQIPTVIPTRDGYEFKGWYINTTGDQGTTLTPADKREGSMTYKELANNTIPTTGTITLHAGWEEVAPTFEPKDDTKPAPNGGLVKSSDKAGKVVQPGEVIHYTVEITPEKTKPATAAEAAVIKGMVASFTIKDAKLAAATNIALTGMTAGEDYTVSGTGDTREFKLTEATQEELTVTYDYTVAAGDATSADADEKRYIENTATVTLKGDEKSSTATSNKVQVEYDVPKVEIVKYVSAIGSATYTKDDKAAMANGTIKAKAGETITWTIEVKNNSKVDTTFTKLSDTLKVGTTESTPTLTLAELEGHRSDTPASIFIPAGGTRTLTAAYPVKDADKGAVIENVAVKAGDPSTNDGTSKITVEKSEYSIKKERTDTNASIKPGDTISYKITVTNTGNVEQENLVIADVLSYTDTTTVAPNGEIKMTAPESGVEWDATAKTFTVTTAVKPGEGNKLEITYTYTVSDQDAGHTIKNTAMVEADKVEEKNPPEVTVQGAYRVEYYFDNVPASEKTVTGNADVGEDILTKAGVTIKEKETVPYNGKDYALDKVVNTATGKVVAGEAAKNTVEIYYKADTSKTGTPDDYEATVIYQIDGGTWADTKVDTDRTVYVPLRTWDTTAKEWKPLTGVKPTNIPEGKHTLDSVDPGKWGLGDEVTGKVNSANAAEPKDQALEAGKIYIFKLSFDPLRAEIVDPAGEGIVEASDRTWEYDGSPHSVKADVAKAPADAKYVLYYSEDDGQTWSTDVPEVTDANEKAPTRVLVEARDSAELYQTLKTSYKLTVTPRPITITVNGASKMEGEADPVFTGGITAGKLVKEGDLGTISYVRTSNVNTTGTHTGILDAIYTANPNYAVTVIRGTLTINSSYTPPINIPTVPTGPTGPTGGTTTIEDEETPLANAVGLNDTDHFAYIIGYEDDTVRPLNNITRAEAVTIFFRLMTDEYRAANWSTENSFSDVSAGSWYNNAVSTVQKAGALEHFAQDEKFLPNQAITRAEFASIAAGFVDSAITGENVGDFSDTEGHWAALAIRKAVEAGWINGVGGNRFAPDETISRAEVMTMVNRMLDRVPDAEHMLPDMKKWTDNPEDAWYYEAVQEATNEHDYERDEMGIVETWTEILTARDWKALEAEWAANGGVLPPAEPVEPAEAEGEAEGAKPTED